MNYKELYYKEIKEQKQDTKYYYNFKLTSGFILGFVIDNVAPLTFGLPMKLLKDYGRVFYKVEVRHSFLYKVLNTKFIGSYIKGFLE